MIDSSSVNHIKVSWGLLGPQRTLTPDIFVIGWIHLLVIFIVCINGMVRFIIRDLTFIIGGGTGSK